MRHLANLEHIPPLTCRQVVQYDLDVLWPTDLANAIRTARFPCRRAVWDPDSASSRVVDGKLRAVVQSMTIYSCLMHDLREYLGVTLLFDYRQKMID
jgi:hypothetical protein